jgi:hypothetical protein
MKDDIYNLRSDVNQSLKQLTESKI